MKERPILFSGEMVRAILSGSKAQTRRVMKPEDVEILNFFLGDDNTLNDLGFVSQNGKLRVYLAEYPDEGGADLSTPYGLSGDRLYVKESFCESKIRDRSVTDRIELIHHAWRYKADAENKPIQVLGHPAKTKAELYKWTSGRFMPRAASRITLEITDIRVEHLQEISVGDIEAEGTPNNPMQQPVYRTPAEAMKAAYAVAQAAIREAEGLK